MSNNDVEQGLLESTKTTRKSRTRCKPVISYLFEKENKCWDNVYFTIIIIFALIILCLISYGLPQLFID